MFYNVHTTTIHMCDVQVTDFTIYTIGQRNAASKMFSSKEFSAVERVIPSFSCRF
jgi:hypothetical protein